MNVIDDNQAEDLWGYAKRLRFVRETISAAFPNRQPHSLSLLDVGCGNGSQLALPLAVKDGFHITGVDKDSRSIERAKQLAGQNPNISFACGGVDALFNKRLFDIVILSEVLEHLERPADLLTASAQLMDPDGILIVTVPNGYGEFEIDSWIYRTLSLQKVVDALAEKHEVLGATENIEDGHIQFFTRSRLKSLFSAAGLIAFREGAGSFLAGPIVGHVLARSTRLINWNARVTDQLPFIFASGWYFALRRAGRETTGGTV